MNGGMFCLFWVDFGGRRSKLVRRSKYRSGTRKVTFEGESWMEFSFPWGDRSHSSLLEGRDKVAQACQDLCYELRLEVVASQHQCWLVSDFDTLAENRFPTIARCTKNSFTSDCFLLGVTFCLTKFCFDFLAFLFCFFLPFMKICEISNRNYEL